MTWAAIYCRLDFVSNKGIFSVLIQLSQRHLDWKNMKMKVRLAAEVLSSSVADALQYLSEVDESFRGAGPTIDFIRKVKSTIYTNCPPLHKTRSRTQPQYIT